MGVCSSNLLKWTREKRGKGQGRIGNNREHGRRENKGKGLREEREDRKLRSEGESSHFTLSLLEKIERNLDKTSPSLGKVPIKDWSAQEPKGKGGIVEDQVGKIGEKRARAYWTVVAHSCRTRSRIVVTCVVVAWGEGRRGITLLSVWERREDRTILFPHTHSS